jgi:hypothetical protein
MNCTWNEIINLDSDLKVLSNGVSDDSFNSEDVSFRDLIFDLLIKLILSAIQWILCPMTCVS